MLDVHAPEHKIGGLKDFTIHLLTITVGLLIALALENAAEALHHRHQRKEAEVTIREELQHNRDDLKNAQEDIQTETKNLVGILDFLESRGRGEPGDASGLSIGFREGPLQDAAWRTAGSTGVLSYMDYAQVQKYSVAYKEQELYETMQQQALDSYLQLDSFVVKGFDPKNVSADDIKAALPVVRGALAHVRGMQDVSNGALQATDAALKR